MSPDSSSPRPLDSDQKFHLAKVRHDLRTPINHVIGYSEILQEEAEGQVPAGFLNDLAKIHSGGKQLLGLINRFLGEESFLTHNTDVQLLCHELRTPANHIIGYSELLLELCDELEKPEFKPDLQKIVLAGKSWLHLMEENLLNENATRFVRKLEPVDKERDDHQDWTRIRTGGSTGRPPHDIFYSEQGHLLLADDDPGNRDLLKRRLEKLGYRVTTCNDGAAALEMLREGSFDLALLDMVMPELDGHEILAEIKNDPDLQNIPVIMISALDQMESIVHCIELGAEDYLQKPYNAVLLRARIGAALEKKRLRDWEKVYIKQIEEEQKQSERLLINVLPQPIADRLKQGESSIVDSFPEVTVLFADLVGFTSMSIRIQPKVVVKLLDEIFTAFDNLAEKHGMEKIKTIGDAYMAVAGVPLPKTNHAQATAAMALDMMSALRKFNHDHQTSLEMRIGINTGPVIAGIIGRKKFIYDLWGDSVNTASRMESHGEPGRIQITESTRQIIESRYETKARGPISIKGKGTLHTYWLIGKKPAHADLR